jgi:LysM repeat protein
MSNPNQPAPSSSGGNVFTRKLGPLPTWGWMGIALAVALVYYFYSKNKSSSTTAQTSATNNTPGGVDSSLVPQFVNQTYVNGSPPAAPNITNNTNSNDTNSNNTAPTGNTSTVNNVTPPVNKPAPPAQQVHYVKYTVKAGDTLQSLSKKYGVTVEQIASAPGNVYVSGEVPGNKKVGQQLGTGAGLKTGMTLNIPQYSG